MTVSGKVSTNASDVFSCKKRCKTELNCKSVGACGRLLLYGGFRFQPITGVSNYHHCLKTLMNKSTVSTQPLRSCKESKFAAFVSPVGNRLQAFALPTVHASSVSTNELPGPSLRAPESTTENDDNHPEKSFKDGFFGFWKSHDGTASPTEIAMHSGQPLYKPLPGETGWDRIKAMYSTDAFGNLGPEWGLIVQGTTSAGIAGVLIGFVLGGRTATINFFDRNEETKFPNEMAARRALQDRITLSIGRASFMWGWRTAVFTGVYLFTVTNMSVYRGETSLLDFTVAGALTGGLWRFMQGPRASLVAGLLGSVLGLVAGGLSLAVFKVTGVSLEELRYWHYQAHVVRQGEVSGKVTELDRGAVYKPPNPFAMHHDTLVMEREAALAKLQDDANCSAGDLASNDSPK